MNHLLNALDSFRCYKDEDIEKFLRTQAFDFLDHQLCSIYLLVDEQLFDDGMVKIDAYFTLSHKTLISEGISKRKIQKVTGGIKDATSLHFVLIGQLGKYMKLLKNNVVISADISASEILDCAFEIIYASSNLIPCRFALVECKDDPKVRNIYEDYGFTLFQYDGKYYQYYKKI